jgi:hypothetical protein
MQRPGIVKVKTSALWNKPDALNKKDVAGGHGSPAAFLITLPKKLADKIKAQNPKDPIGRAFLLSKDPKKELEHVELDVNAGIDLLGMHFDSRTDHARKFGDLVQSSKPAAPFMLMCEGADSIRIIARGCGHAFELKGEVDDRDVADLDDDQHEQKRTKPLKAGEIKERDLQVKIARGLKGRRTLQPHQIKETILEKFHAIEAGSENEFYLERSAIFGCVEFEGRLLCIHHPHLRFFTFVSFNSFAGQPEQAIKEEVSKLCNYLSNGDRKGFYELRHVGFSCIILFSHRKTQRFLSFISSSNSSLRL